MTAKTTTIQYGIIMSLVMIMSLAVIIPSNGSILAQESSSETNYLEQAIVIFDEIQTLESEIQEHQKDIATKSVGINQAELESMIDQKILQTEKLNQEIDRLEALNIALYEVDAATEAKFYGAEKVVFDAYFGDDSSKNNPIITVGPNFKDRTLEVLVDTIVLEEMSITEKQISRDISKLVKNSFTDVKVDVVFTEFKEISCASKTTDCATMISGISATVKYDTDINTMGYKAKDGSNVGFVMTAHSVNDNGNANIQQSHSSSTNRQVGNVDEIETGQCDCAWVDSTVSVDAEIWKNSSGNYDVVAKKNDAFQVNGEFVYKVGASTGLSLGSIHLNPSSTGLPTQLSIYHAGGDSGATVFTKSGNSATIYGMMYGTGGGYALYHGHDYIENQLGITTSTS